MSNFSVIGQAPKVLVNADFHGERSTSPDAPIRGGRAIFGTEGEEFDPAGVRNSRPVAADVDLLFSAVNPNLRFDSAQPNHFADVVRGLRQKPQVKHVITHAPTDKETSTYPVVQTHDRRVFLPQVVGGRAVIHCLNTVTGTLAGLNVTAEGYVAEQFLKQASASRTAVVLPWLARSANATASNLMMTCVDALGENVRWTRAILSPPTDRVSFIHETASGDFAVLCGLNYSTARLLILNKETGETKHECCLPREDAAHFGEMPLAPIFFNGGTRASAVIGLTLVDTIRSHLYLIDFSTGEMNRIDSSKIPLSTSDFVQLANGNALLLPRHYAGTDPTPQRVTFSNDHTFQVMPFELPPDFDTSYKLALNRNQKFAVAPHKDGFSFFSISDTKLELLKLLPLPRVVNWDPLSPSLDYTVMTADDVVYHSRAVRHENDEIVYCLYAFDAATREELWTVEHAFKSPPAVVVNDNGSITWVSRQTAVILGS